MDLGVCARANGTADTRVDAGDVAGSEALQAPESKGPFGAINWRCPSYSALLGNDTSRLCASAARDTPLRPSILPPPGLYKQCHSM